MTLLAAVSTDAGSCVAETVVDGSGNLTGIRTTNTLGVPVTLHLDTSRGFNRTYTVPVGSASTNIPNNRRVLEASESWGFWMTIGG